MDSSRAPRVWQSDVLLKRAIGKGYFKGLRPPAGWVAKFDQDGKNWERIAVGFRNPYDIAFNEDGDLFTYDSDMEYDQGMPWYRPTRVCMVSSGSEFGWRFASGKWPVRWEDGSQPVHDIGPGSPTGVTFGFGADLPEVACSLTRTFSQSDLIKKLKVSSTKWMKENFDESFSWQTGYGVFSIGESQLSALVSYIENQVEHHRMKSFKDEFRVFLNKYNINFDEQYVWE